MEYTLIHSRVDNGFMIETKIEELEADLWKVANSVTRGSPAGRIKSRVPPPLANRLDLWRLKLKLPIPLPAWIMRENGDRPGSQRTIFEEPTWDEADCRTRQVAPQVTTKDASQTARVPADHETRK